MSDRINSPPLKAETTNIPFATLVRPFFLGLFMQLENELMYNYLLSSLTFLPSQAEKKNHTLLSPLLLISQSANKAARGALLAGDV